MRQLTKALIFLGLWLTTTGRAAAWHNAGHMTIARIAYQELSDEQKVQVAKILKAHPHYQRFLIVLWR
jgi:hypothetical protein